MSRSRLYCVLVDTVNSPMDVPGCLTLVYVRGDVTPVNLICVYLTPDKAWVLSRMCG